MACGGPDAASRFDPEMLCQLPQKLRAAQAIFGRTGGLHAAALFDTHGELLVLREDIAEYGRFFRIVKEVGYSGGLSIEGNGKFEDDADASLKFFHDELA